LVYHKFQHGDKEIKFSMTEIKKDVGVTLIELMIVMVIAVILVAGIYTLFMTQQRSYSVQDQVTGAQQDARAALNIIARDIRMAGAMIGAGDASGFTDGTNYFSIGGYNYAVNSVVNNDNDSGNNRMDGTDAIAIVCADRELGFVSSIPATGTIQLDQAFNCPSFITSETHAGKVFQVSGCSGNQITLNNFSASSFVQNEKVFAVNAIEYRVGKSTSSPSFFVLRRNDQPLIGDDNFPIVEDLQIAYQLEGSSDWIYDPAHTWPAGKTFADIRMVRINITVRTAIPDAVVQDAAPTAQFKQPELEDHTANLNGPDGFRRRVYTTVVKVRNLK
jgi:type IV pilus assembly protein PilW